MSVLYVKLLTLPLYCCALVLHTFYIFSLFFKAAKITVKLRINKNLGEQPVN